MPPKYRLTTLGWYNFEILVQTLLKQIIGPGVSSIGGTKDQGRDAHFRGSAAFPSGETSWSGEWIFQIKYVETDDSREAQQRLRNSFKNEAHTILQRRRKGKINNYILLTNAPASAKLRGELETATNHFADRFGLIDGKEICQFLDLHPPIRRAYPQLLGLADLDLIVNRRTYERSKAYMQEWQPKLCTFVKTTVFEKALNTLEQRHFIVLDGPPEAGKSTIAAALAVLKAAESFQVVQLLGADEFFNVYDENSLQLFIADDAVGSIKFDPSLSDGWSRNLGAILSTLNAKHLLVWTTRKYVLEEALAETRLGEAVKDFPRVQEVLVEVDKFSTLEKASMLYNHAKHARLTPESKDLIRNCAREIAAHRDFTPERVRQLCQNVLAEEEICGSFDAQKRQIMSFLQNPSRRWRQAHAKLNQSERTLLLSMFDFRFYANLSALRHVYESRIGPGSANLGFLECLGRLEHSFLRRWKSWEGTEHVDFQHPSLRDLLVGELRHDPGARRRYIDIASPFGIQSMCVGLAESGGSESPTEHAFWPQNDEEANALVRRIEELARHSLSKSEWDSMLTAADRLVPRERVEVCIAGGWLREQRVQKVELAGEALAKFAESKVGRILGAIIGGFGKEETFQKNLSYTVIDWFELLEKYYLSASYCLPFARPDFIVYLLRLALKEPMARAVGWISMIAKNEPRVTEQVLGRTGLREVVDYVGDRVEELTEDGEQFEEKGQFGHGYSEVEEGLHDEYVTWSRDAVEVLKVAKTLSEALGAGVEGTERLQELVETTEAPPEPKYDVSNRGSVIKPSDWTIERIFEDL